MMKELAMAIFVLSLLPLASAECVVTSEKVPIGELVQGDSAKSVALSYGCPIVVSRVAEGYYVVSGSRFCVYSENLKPYGEPAVPVRVDFTDKGDWIGTGFQREFMGSCTIQVFNMPRDKPKPVVVPVPEPEPEPEWTANGVKDGTETDVDCGGTDGAPTCEAGQKCLANNDCSGKCNHYKIGWFWYYYGFHWQYQNVGRCGWTYQEPV